MTEEELSKKTPEEVAKLPWDYPGLIIMEGRYYSRLMLVGIPRAKEFPFGGDLLATLWRYDNDPPDEWVLTMRIRYNGGPDTDPWDHRDRKSWSAARVKCDLATAVRKMTEMGEMITGIGGMYFGKMPDIDWLVIEGDHKKFFETAEREKKPWMHFKTKPVPRT